MSQPPFLLVIAGPNGSGKTTLVDYLMESGIDFGEHINADQIAATLDLPEPQRSEQAQGIADFQRQACLDKGLDFSFETVMSHPSKVEFMIRADDAGYDVTLFFVCTSDPDINLSRVENRVAAGGHSVPRDRIVARYHRTLGLLSHAALIAKRTLLFDNSAIVGFLPNSRLPNQKSGLRPVGEVVRDGSSYDITLEADVPAWVLEYLVLPLDVLAHQSEGRILLTINQKPDVLG
ncbi:zeta toxin family protein [Rhodopseudomonas palustris]|uniref:Zeta toxin domain-containing protein n=1 Tax=Rhodopseudomonas palustris (strain BisB5) TaxID=316057 RepID=Q138M3_RHOPS|nr:conserved hypothetical protein [Rhodopseudomonas palustris BisB5]MBB1092067.1 zeta toxin family protein [Rhodopseudomonas palustris]